MWSFFKTILISIVVILSSHYLFHYLKETLTIKKKKDVIHHEISKYKDILENYIDKKSKKHSSKSDADRLFEDAMDSLKDFDNESVVDFTSMEQELIEYAEKHA